MSQLKLPKLPKLESLVGKNPAVQTLAKFLIGYGVLTLSANFFYILSGKSKFGKKMTKFLHKFKKDYFPVQQHLPLHYQPPAANVAAVEQAPAANNRHIPNPGDMAEQRAFQPMWQDQQARRQQPWPQQDIHEENLGARQMGRLHRQPRM